MTVTGEVPDEHLAAIYTGARALLLPSSDEGFGLTPIEALACGTPVVACDVPAVREVLCVSQFTLYGDTRRGNRPSYITAASAEHAEPLYRRFCEQTRAQSGVFGAHMEVELVNDGPVTLMIE